MDNIQIPSHDIPVPVIAPAGSAAEGPVFDTKFEHIGPNEVLLNLGPQHPSTHGVLRVVLTLNGEMVTGAAPDVGYLHRGVEKLSEYRTYPQMVVLTDRLDYLTAMANNWVYCLAVEKLLKVEIPTRAEYLRVITGELNRIASHLVFFGTFGIDIGAFTPFLYAFGREREKILDLFEEICGARITYNYIRIGGVMADAPEGWIDRCKEFVRYMKPMFKEYDDLLTYNPIFMDRTQGIGAVSKEKAISYGVSGPNLRACGVDYDLRRDAPYSVYKDFQFNVPIRQNGDCFDRFLVRRLEMEESLRIVEQALEKIPAGETMGKVPKANLRPPAGETYAHIESSRGWQGIYVISNGTDKPYRLHIRPPSFINLQMLQEILKGYKVADMIAILGSIDIVLGEVDR